MVSLLGLSLRFVGTAFRHKASASLHYTLGSLARYWVVERVLSF